MGASVEDGEKHTPRGEHGDDRRPSAAEGASFALRPPSDWSAARQRAAVVREYLSLEKRTAKIADDYAERLGLSRSRFYGLVQAFRDAEDGLLRRHASLGAKRLDHRVEEVIAGAIAACGDDASLTTVSRAVEALCRLRSLVPPSPAAIRRRMPTMVKTAPDGVPLDQEHPIIIDEIDLRLAVRSPNGRLVTPTFTAVITPATGRVLGHDVSIDPDERDGASAALTDALSGPDAAEASLTDLELAVSALLDARVRDRGRAITSLFGVRLGSIILRPRKRGSVMDGRTAEIELDLARAAVRRLVAEHNDGREPAGLSGPDLLNLLTIRKIVQPQRLDAPSRTQVRKRTPGQK
jgi:hypothetical protein